MYKNSMKKLKPILITLSLLTAPFTQALTPVEVSVAKPQVAGYYHYDFNGKQITALLDGTNYLSPSLFKGLSEQERQDILKKYYAINEKGIQTSVNAFLIDTGTGLALIDTGAASCFGAHLGSVVKNLEQAGFQTSQINAVYLTHLHPDHVCGIAKNGAAVFPNATIYASELEVNYWLDPQQVDKIPKENQEKYLATVEKIKQAIAPYQQEGRLKTFKAGQQISAELTSIESAGHTPGHVGFALKQADQEMVFIGDIVHSHTLQFDRPKTAVDFDIQPEQAVQTRLKYFAQYAKEGKTVAAPHLPFPGIGHIYSKDGQSYQWIPVHFKD